MLIDYIPKPVLVAAYPAIAQPGLVDILERAGAAPNMAVANKPLVAAAAIQHSGPASNTAVDIPLPDRPTVVVATLVAAVVVVAIVAVAIVVVAADSPTVVVAANAVLLDSSAAVRIDAWASNWEEHGAVNSKPVVVVGVAVVDAPHPAFALAVMVIETSVVVVSVVVVAVAIKDAATSLVVSAEAVP